MSSSFFPEKLQSGSDRADPSSENTRNGYEVMGRSVIPSSTEHPSSVDGH
ncbi:hypothetical protein ACN4EK_26655 [Pantanalinema rosaneae CENA516]